MKKPKVLMFGWEFPPHNSGGLGVACFGLTRALARQGADVLFVLPRNVGIDNEHIRFLYADLPETVTTRSIETLMLPYMTSRQYERYAQKYGTLHYGNDLYAEVHRYAAAAEEIVKKENYDVIHAHDWLSFPAGMRAKKLSGKPLVAHIHATEFDRGGGLGIDSRVYEIEKQGMQQADKVVTVSQHTKNIVVSKYKISEEKVAVVHNGIDDDYFKFDSKGDVESQLHSLKRDGYQIVLYVGRFTVQKGIDQFIKAAKIVSQYRSDVLFILAGTGELREQLIRQSASLGISDKVLFSGFLRGKFLVDAYKNADLVVMPSVSEPFGLIPLEAMLCGTPALISKQSGVAEAVTHVLKTDFWDINDMANKIIASLEHQSLKECLRQNGYSDIKRLNWRSAAQKCLSLYQGLCLVN
jgi:glycosyltransferase involved in cell wall biosynthesis